MGTKKLISRKDQIHQDLLQGKRMEMLRHELLLDIERIVKEVHAEHNASPAIAELCGSAISDYVSSEWAGQNLTFPKDFAWRLTKRDMDVYERYNGHNHLEIARDLGITPNAVYRLIKRVKRIAVAQHQPDIFNS